MRNPPTRLTVGEMLRAEFKTCDRTQSIQEFADRLSDFGGVVRGQVYYLLVRACDKSKKMECQDPHAILTREEDRYNIDLPDLSDIQFGGRWTMGTVIGDRYFNREGGLFHGKCRLGSLQEGEYIVKINNALVLRDALKKKRKESTD